MLQKKTGEWYSIEGFEELQYVPSNLEGHEYVQGCIHAQERPEQALILTSV